MSTTDTPTLLDGGDASAGTQRIPLNVYETTEAMVIVAPMPGVQAEDVAIAVDGKGQLHLSARLRTAAPKDYLLHEWDYGSYERVYELPEGFDGALSASLGNGQLAVRVARDGERGTDSPILVHPTTAGGDD